MPERESVRRNELGQPIGRAILDWKPCPEPDGRTLEGRLCRVERLDTERHAAALHAAFAEDEDGRGWTYLPYGPFEDAAAYRGFLEFVRSLDGTLFYAIVDRASEAPVGVAAYLRIAPDMGSIEVGHLRYAPVLQRTATSTEAMYLMMRHAFEALGYRRYEWKCDSLNAASLAAARRLGFRFEGTFRNAMVIKGRNRDTSWLSITDEEWPGIRRALERWLDPGNFDAQGRQVTGLTDFMP